MSKNYKFLIFSLFALAVVLICALLLRGGDVVLLNPKGIIADKERNLIVTAVLLMFSIVIPVFILTFFIAWKFRESNTSAKYAPDWTGNKILVFTWWAAPSVIILILAVVTWKNTHALDPRKPLESLAKPITIEVVALRWKWLFIYPEQNIATVNFIQFPEQTPINFELTADAPMNSFWIPALSGQIYAMAGMGTYLHLMADKAGEFAGSGAEISGQGFSGMKFVVRASSHTDFDAWVEKVKESPNILDLVEYNKLAKPSIDNPVTVYSLTEADLYNNIIMKYMTPSPSGYGNMHMEGMKY